jgi:hypothetical protein
LSGEMPGRAVEDMPIRECFLHDRDETLRQCGAPRVVSPEPGEMLLVQSLKLGSFEDGPAVSERREVELWPIDETRQRYEKED